MVGTLRGRFGRTAGLIVSVALLVGVVTTVLSPTAGAVQYPQAKLVAGQPASWTPWVDNGAVRAITQVGSKIYVGGSFTSVRQAGASTAVSQPYLFAFDATTGAIDTAFRPRLNAAVNAIVPAPSGTGIIVGGRFSTVNGQSRGKLVMLNTSGGTVATFAPNVTGGNVLDLVVRNGLVYVGGGFVTVNGTTQPVLAAVDASTGALSARLRPTISGTWNGGETHIEALDVTPTGSRLVIAGNFTTIDGQDRVQLAQFDLTTTPNQLANWATDRLEPLCLDRFTSIANDVDYAPDGSYFALVTTGAFMGGADAGVLCDTTTRWETNATGTDVQPTWIDYAGGDTQVGVAVTATAVYTSGHMRWQNDPYAGDAAGPGSVSRQGLSALDPRNGLPFSWNPTRSISNGSWDTTLFATSTGLWLGFDRDVVGRQTHKRLAFFPLNGGKAVPEPTSASLPGRLYSLPDDGCDAVDPSILVRVNAGGPELGSLDCGPDWLADDGPGAPGAAFHTVGTNSTSWANPVTISYEPTGSIPTSTPAAVFDTERWDPDGSPEMSWTFPVAAGTPIEVRLYLIDQCDCTGPGGTPRAFDVRLDNQLVLDDYNIVADVGHRVATVKRFDITSDGNVNIDFRHVSENPLVNAVEIVRSDVAPTEPQERTFLTWRTFDGTTAGPMQQLTTPAADWSTARGAFLIGGTLYYGQTDGNLYSRPFTQTGVGGESLLFPYVVSPGPVFANVSGMFFTNGRIYYTEAGDATMHYRYFTPESGVVGAVEFDVPSNGFAWSLARGLTLADGRIYWSTPDGSLHRATFTNGEPSGPDQVVSGPAVDGQTWDGNGMFVSSSTSSDTQAPTQPGNLRTTSVSASSVALAWDASSDTVGVTEYVVSRNGSPLATVPGSSRTYTDTSVTPATSYTYDVKARDAAGNTSSPSNSVNVTTPSGSSPTFSDGFESGDLSKWDDAAGMTVDTLDSAEGQYSAHGVANGGRASATEVLSSTTPTISYRTAFKVVSHGANGISLLGLEDVDGTRPIVTAFVRHDDRLMLRNEVAQSNIAGGVAVRQGVWHTLQIDLTVDGASSTVRVTYDGSVVSALTRTLDIGTTPVGRIVLGESLSGRTSDVRYDDVRVS